MRALRLSAEDISKIDKLFRWRMNFHRPDEEWKVVLLIEMDEVPCVLGLCFRIRGDEYHALRAQDGNFYDREAQGLVFEPVICPISLQRFSISSSFNPRRINPVTRKVVPHRGVDFAVPDGTPVVAVGDGRVTVSGSDSIAGNYVSIDHDNRYTTRYMHLRRVLVSVGQKVRRGDLVALSGNTGRSTGPHLHFELWINKRAVDPLTARIPRAVCLTGDDRLVHLARLRQLIRDLARHERMAESFSHPQHAAHAYPVRSSQVSLHENNQLAAGE